MKKTILGLLILSLTATSAFATDYNCKSAYETEIARLQKTQKIRNIGRIAAEAAVYGTLIIGAPVGAIGLISASVSYFGPAVLLLAAGPASAVDLSERIPHHLFKTRLEKISLAKVMIEDSFDRDAAIETRRIAFAQKHIAHQLMLSNSVDYAMGVKAALNKKREFDGLPLLTIAEVREMIRQVPVPPLPESEMITPLTYMAAELEMDVKDLQSRILELNPTDAFCPDGKALKYKQLRKLFKGDSEGNELSVTRP